MFAYLIIIQANSLVGEAMVFTLVDAAKEWLSNLPEAETSQTIEQEVSGV